MFAESEKVSESPFSVRASCSISSALAIQFLLLRCCLPVAFEQLKDDWIGAIGRAIVQASSTYQNDHRSDDSDSDLDR